VNDGLRAFPGGHWLVAKKGEALLEGGQYSRALSEFRNAEKLMPSCPLVLWGLAGALDALGRRTDAARLYQRLTNRGPVKIARGECGEGLNWSRGLVADAYYRRGLIAEAQGDWGLSRDMYQRYLMETVRLGAVSIYSRHLVESRLKKLERSAQPQRRRPNR
jgi:predicted Zn-dependent protease